jgi:hypothetical protein
MGHVTASLTEPGAMHFASVIVRIGWKAHPRDETVEQWECRG